MSATRQHLRHIARDDYDLTKITHRRLLMNQPKITTPKEHLPAPKAARWDTLLKTKAILPTGIQVMDVNHRQGCEVAPASSSRTTRDEIESPNFETESIPEPHYLRSTQLGNEVPERNLINTFYANFSNPEYNGEKLSLKSKDIHGGREYFLGQFALAERWGRAASITQKVRHSDGEMLQPYNGVYDPARWVPAGSFVVSR